MIDYRSQKLGPTISLLCSDFSLTIRRVTHGWSFGLNLNDVSEKSKTQASPGLRNFMFVSSPPNPLQTTPATTNNPAMKPFALIPDVPWGETGWCTVVKDWEEADPSWSLAVPLKDWPEEWHKRNELGSKFNQCRLIVTEFIDEWVLYNTDAHYLTSSFMHSRYDRDKTHFKSDYPEHKKGITLLMKAILHQHQLAGKSARRNGKTSL